MLRVCHSQSQLPVHLAAEPVLSVYYTSEREIPDYFHRAAKLAGVQQDTTLGSLGDNGCGEEAERLWHVKIQGLATGSLV